MTAFVRLLEVTADRKGEALSSAIAHWRSGGDPEGVFPVEPSGFAEVPGSPLAYWVGAPARRLFTSLQRLESEGREVQSGLSTMDDARYIRSRWEVDGSKIAHRRSDTLEGAGWIALAKGGGYSPYHADLDLVVNWELDGRAMKAAVTEYRGARGWGYNWSAALNGHGFYFRPGVTWSRRSQRGLSVRALGQGAAIGDKGPTVFPDKVEQLPILLGIMNSGPFKALVALQMAFGSYEVGVIERTPVPNLNSEEAKTLGHLAVESWSKRRLLDANRLESTGFYLPGVLRVPGDSLRDRIVAFQSLMVMEKAELSAIEDRMEDLASRMYGFESGSALDLLDVVAVSVSQGNGGAAEPDEDDGPLEGTDEGPQLEGLLEWLLSCALARFDIRLATGQRPPPPAPAPFDPLPVSSPGMLQDDSGLPVREAPRGYPLALPPHGILVDDPGHPWDVVARMEAVLELVAGDRAHAWMQEIEEILGRDLRDWVRRFGFERHLKRYSRSRRKAPLFWHLAPKSREYGIWLYSPAATRDTMYRILNDYLDPKLRTAERRLVEVRQEAGASPTAQQRRDIAGQESLVNELRAFREEVAWVAPLWAPFRDDGVVLNCAVLHRLFDHHRVWQKDCEGKWKELAKGKYDWAGWAMHLWPERVLKSCASDRSIAIAHGLEKALWEEDANGKWRPRTDAKAQMARLAEERSSPALQAALDAFNRAG